MLRDTLDRKSVRIAIAICAGLPLTVLFMLLFPAGLMMGIVGIREGEIPTLMMGIAALLGLAGLIGAWLRITRHSQSFSRKLKAITRTLLACGIVASLILLTVTIWAGTWILFGLPAFGLLIAGVLFYAGT